MKTFVALSSVQGCHLIPNKTQKYCFQSFMNYLMPKFDKTNLHI